MPISVKSPRSAAGLAPALRALVRSALALEGAVPGEIAIVLSDDAELRALNRRWRGIDRATDVLSFPYEEAPTGGAPTRVRRGVSGDLVISLDRMEEQAKRYRVTRGLELARLVIHGTLHLAGLDHHRAAERRTMRAREDEALRGVAAGIRRLDGMLVHDGRRRGAGGRVHRPTGGAS